MCAEESFHLIAHRPITKRTRCLSHDVASVGTTQGLELAPMRGDASLKFLKMTKSLPLRGTRPWYVRAADRVQPITSAGAAIVPLRTVNAQRLEANQYAISR